MGQMAAAGGAIGTAFAPGIGTAIGSVLGGMLDEESKASGASNVPSSSSAATAVYGSGLNADNWFVNFSGTQNASAKVDKPFSATGPTATTAATGGTVLPGQPVGLSGVASSLGLDLSRLDNIPLWAWACLAGLVVWRIKSKK